jgi:hypothetical protein
VRSAPPRVPLAPRFVPRSRARQRCEPRLARLLRLSPILNGCERTGIVDGRVGIRAPRDAVRTDKGGEEDRDEEESSEHRVALQKGLLGSCFIGMELSSRYQTL